MNLFGLAALVASLFFIGTPTYAQWQAPNHSVPTGRGAGVTGFGSAAPGTAGLPLASNGASSDPSFQVLGNAGLAQMQANTVKCNPTASVANAQDCTSLPSSMINQSCISIDAFGGKADGTTDNTTAYNAAMAAIGSSNGCLQFGAGIYKFNSNGLSKTLSGVQSLTVRGSGEDSTWLDFPNAGDGLVFTFTTSGIPVLNGNSLAVMDISLVTDNQNSAGACINVNGNATTGQTTRTTAFQNVGCRGGPGGGGGTGMFYWGYGYKFNQVANVLIQGGYWYGCGGCTPYVGTGIFFSGGTSSAQYVTGLTVNGFAAGFGQYGIYIGPWVQGLMVNSANLTDFVNGVFWNTNGAGEPLEPQCSVQNSQIAINLGAAGGVSTNGGGIVLFRCGQGTIANNMIYSTIGSAIRLFGSANITIAANNIVCNSAGGVVGIRATSDGVATNSTQNNITGNNISLCPGADISLESATLNTLTGNFLYDQNANDAGTSNSWSNNPGFNFPKAGGYFSYTPTVTFTGGTGVSAVAVSGGSTIGQNKSTCFQAAFAVNYTTVPTGMTVTVPSAPTKTTTVNGYVIDNGIPIFALVFGASATTTKLTNASNAMPLTSSGQTVEVNGCYN